MQHIEIIINDLKQTKANASFKGKNYECVLGKNGVISADDKKEGDSKTPLGIWRLKRVFFREDKLKKPQTKLPVTSIKKNHAWCDDINCADYNKLVELPHNGSYENLWRDDNIYDVIIEISHNDNPPVKKKGSAIFIHIARENKNPTAGCIAFSLEDILEILEYSDKDTYIYIKY